jgi:hypothetical protein
MDGPGFHVDIEVLETASKNMQDLWHSQDEFELRGLCGEPELYGHGGVHDALADFCGQWSVGMDACVTAQMISATCWARPRRRIEPSSTRIRPR